MIILKRLTAEQVHTTIARGEFDQDVIAPERNVAVVMTQSWCGQWLFMRLWIDKEARAAAGDGQPVIDVFVLEYDREPFFAEFLAFKEQRFGNTYVPYIRFYRNGRLVQETNYVSKSAFYGVFRDATP